LFGVYSAPLLTVTVSDVASSSGLGINNVGDFVGVKVNYPSGLPLTEASFTSLNPAFPDFAATGYTGILPNITNTFTATGQSPLKPAIRVTF